MKSDEVVPSDRAERWLARPLRRFLSWRPGTDGRVVLLAMVAAYLLTIAAGRLIWRTDLWPTLGVPSGPSLFFDARNLMAALECHRLGYDPLYQNPCDPRQRPLMYLRSWLLLAPLGLEQTHTAVVASALDAAMFLTFAALFRRIPAGTGVVLGVAACSPAIMLAVERANMDVALFTLMTLSILLWRRLPSAAQVLSPSFVLIAATAKIYPVVALGAFVVSGSVIAARTALVCISSFAVYAAYSYADIRRVGEIAIQGDHFSFGARILPAHLYHQVGADHWAGPPMVKQLIAMVPLVLLALGLARWITSRLGATDSYSRATAPLLALHVGALLYLGTFALANNFDYRLVFLLLTLPQLTEWLRRPPHRLSSLASASLTSVLALLWVGSLSYRLNLWDEIASWTTAGLLAAVLFATMPKPAPVLATLRGRVPSARRVS